MTLAFVAGEGVDEASTPVVVLIVVVLLLPDGVEIVNTMLVSV